MAEKELTPWRPFTELSTFRREMDRLWDSFFGERPLARIWEREWAPSLDVSETKDNFLVKAEVPGMDAKDINISLTGDMLTIKGEKKKKRTITSLREVTVPFPARSDFPPRWRAVRLRPHIRTGSSRLPSPSRRR